jgi:glycosyltransferase involved in cell wall biosynthesis
MRVSVAIATYKRSAMVKQAVEAALAQSQPPDEIVVTDDASPDDTWPVLQAMAAKHPAVKVFRRAENSGGVENWNYAVRETTGDYIAWCSDDDRFLPDHIKASVAYLEENPQVGLVHSSFVDIIETPEGTLPEPRVLRYAQAAIIGREQLLSYMTRYYDWPFHPSTIVIRREVWNRVGPFDPKWALADTDWFVRVVEQFQAAMLPRHGVMNRRHPGNWSNRVGSARMQAEIFAIVEGSIERIHKRHPFRRMGWKALWCANVRLRLALTLVQRVKGGHTQAALATWEAMARHTGRGLPGAVERVGEMVIRKLCARRQPRFGDVRQTVSPL